MAELPPGFRFYPTEEELVCFYLRSKLDGRRRDDIERVIPVADVCALDPWQLPEVHRCACAGGEPWFYFCRRQEREARGGRPSRTTPSGFWKAAGTPGWVYAADGRPIGTKKTMVFYRGRAPAGTKTKWKMNEYRALEDADAAPPSHALQIRSEFSLCRLYTESGHPRQFDSRPRAAAAAAGGGGENHLIPSSSTAALFTSVEETTGRKRKRSPQNDDTSSSNDGDGGHGHSPQQLSAQGAGTEDGGLVDGTDDWAEFLDWF